jgi:hypothetical protein
MSRDQRTGGPTPAPINEAAMAGYGAPCRRSRRSEGPVPTHCSHSLVLTAMAADAPQRPSEAALISFGTGQETVIRHRLSGLSYADDAATTRYRHAKKGTID